MIQSSLTGLFRLPMFNPGLASWAIFSRPFGTDEMPCFAGHLSEPQRG